MALIVGLTGGIGSGKSAATSIFESLGIPVIDSDSLARRVVEPGSTALKQIKQRFGEAVINARGELDRATLREKIFSSQTDKLWLESLLHPLIRQETERQISLVTTPYAILSAPLLIEKKVYELTDVNVVIDIPEAMQRSRAAARDHSDPEQIQKIIDSQVSRAKRLDFADYIIDNSGSLSDLQAQVNTLHKTLLKHAEES